MRWCFFWQRDNWLLSGHLKELASHRASFESDFLKHWLLCVFWLFLAGQQMCLIQKIKTGWGSRVWKYTEKRVFFCLIFQFQKCCWKKKVAKFHALRLSSKTSDWFKETLVDHQLQRLWMRLGKSIGDKISFCWFDFVLRSFTFNFAVTGRNCEEQVVTPWPVWWELKQICSRRAYFNRSWTEVLRNFGQGFSLSFSWHISLHTFKREWDGVAFWLFLSCESQKFD